MQNIAAEYVVVVQIAKAIKLQFSIECVGFLSKTTKKESLSVKQSFWEFSHAGFEPEQDCLQVKLGNQQASFYEKMDGPIPASFSVIFIFSNQHC